MAMEPVRPIISIFFVAVFWFGLFGVFLWERGVVWCGVVCEVDDVSYLGCLIVESACAGIVEVVSNWFVQCTP